ncbi:hypothetical protein ACH5RR_023376 [Cinchona calisaya]|uniref:Uncharacterized protein n=1 Tax=Cinchona calisaya TaxID=153742 RepID=A0ABD2ZC13_9GENT
MALPIYENGLGFQAVTHCSRHEDRLAQTDDKPLFKLILNQAWKGNGQDLDLISDFQYKFARAENITLH